MKVKTNKYTSLHHFLISVKECMILLFLAFALLSTLFLLQGCSNDNDTESEKKQHQESPNFSMDTKSLTSDLIDNLHMYVFKPNNDFVKRQWSLTNTGSKITTSMEEGQWGLVLLSCNSDITDKITVPYGANRIGSKMWETQKIQPAQDYLSQTPEELRYAFVPGVNIVPDATETKSAILQRNVAKIQIILDEYTGFESSNIHPGKNDFAFVELHNVPTTLGWDGKYLPSKDAPYTSDKPIRVDFDFDNTLKAKTVDFIIPAHRGDDAFEAVHADTTKHKLKLKVSMPLNNGSYYGETVNPIEIPYTPKINRIVQVWLKFRGEPQTKLDVKVTVKDWEDYSTQEETFN